MRSNVLGSDACTFFERVLRQTAVADLLLGRNDLGSEGAQRLSTVFVAEIGHFSRVAVLDLAHTRIGHTGAGALFTNIVKNSYLRRLHLDRNDDLDGEDFRGGIVVLFEGNLSL